MKKRTKTEASNGGLDGTDPIGEYGRSQPAAFRSMCETLRGLIDAGLPKATSMLWHGSPVWFIGENPVVGYTATTKKVNLLFWNGQAFGEAKLRPVGKARAAQAEFADASEIEAKTVRRWLKQAGADVFDSRAFYRKLRESRA